MPSYHYPFIKHLYIIFKDFEIEMCLIDISHLKGINLLIFMWFKNSFKSGAKKRKEEKCEENWVIFRSVYFMHH